MTNSHKLHCSVQCLLLLSETLIHRLVSLLGFSIHKGANVKIVIESLKNLSLIKSGWGTRPLLKLRRGSAPSARAPSSLLQHWLKCCVHLHLERHIKFAPMSNLVVLGWAHEKSDFWVGQLGIIINLLSLYPWMVVPSIDIVSSCCSWFHLVDTVSAQNITSVQ